MMSGKIKLAAAGAVVVLVLVVGLYFALRTTPQDVARDFLAAIGSGEVEDAYKYLSPESRARQNLDVFERTVEDLNLVNFAAVSWAKVNDDDENTVTLDGQVQTKAGEMIPMHLVLTRTPDGGWLVEQFGKPVTAPTSPPAP